MAVIEQLELIEIHHQHRERESMPARMRDLRDDSFTEIEAIESPCQGVPGRGFVEPALQVLFDRIDESETQHDVRPELDAASWNQLARGCRLTIDPRAVRRAQILDDVTAGNTSNAHVRAADTGVI